MDAETRYNALFAEAYPTLQRYARYRGLRGDDAEDLVAETLTVAWRRLADVPVDEPIPWLVAVARNLWRNDRRRDGRRRRLAVGLPVAAAALPADEVAGTSQSVVLRAMAGLSEVDQEVLRLVVWEGFSAAQAGVVLGCSAGAVRVRLHRARTRLAEALEGAGVVVGVGETCASLATGPGHENTAKETADEPLT